VGSATVGYGKDTTQPRRARGSGPGAPAAQARAGRLAARAALGRQARLGGPVRPRRDRRLPGSGPLLHPGLVRSLPPRGPARAAPTASAGPRARLPIVARTGPSVAPETGGGRVPPGGRRPPLAGPRRRVAGQAGDRLQVLKKSRRAAEGPAPLPRKKGRLGVPGLPRGAGRAPRRP
jgi:hypothetical protein